MTAMRPASIGPQHTGRARDRARCIAAVRAFSACCAVTSRPVPRWNVQPGETLRMTPEQFDTGKMHGPHAGMAGWWIVALAVQGIDPEHGRPVPGLPTHSPRPLCP